MTRNAVNFDRVARPYRWLEYLSFGPWLARCRNAHLPLLQRSRMALVLGDGDGRFLVKLLAAQPALAADVVDSSQCMLHLLERRVQQLGPQARGQVSLHHADALLFRVTRRYDLFISHFFLDCFFPQQLEQLFDSILPHALPGAYWVISEFSIPRQPWARAVAKGIVRWLYRAFGMLTGLQVRTLPDYATLLVRHGFILTAERHYVAGLLCSQVWCLAGLQPDADSIGRQK